MTSIETAKKLARIGAIISIVFGTIYFLLGIVPVVVDLLAFGKIYFTLFSLLAFSIPMTIVGILSLIFGILTLVVARKRLLKGDLLTAAIMCFIFGVIAALAIGGIIIIVAGVFAVIARNEQERAEVPKSFPPPPPPPS